MLWSAIDFSEWKAVQSTKAPSTEGRVARRVVEVEEASLEDEREDRSTWMGIVSKAGLRRRNSGGQEETDLSDAVARVILARLTPATLAALVARPIAALVVAMLAVADSAARRRNCGGQQNPGAATYSFGDDLVKATVHLISHVVRISGETCEFQRVSRGVEKKKLVRRREEGGAQGDFSWRRDGRGWQAPGAQPSWLLPLQTCAESKVRTSHSHALTVMSGVQMWGQHVLFFVCRLLVVNYSTRITQICFSF